MLPLLRRYQSTVMGSFQTVELIETFINYQESIKRCIALVVDPASYASGTPALKVSHCSFMPSLLLMYTFRLKTILSTSSSC